MNPELAVPPNRKLPVQQTEQKTDLNPTQEALLKKLYYEQSLFVGRDRLSAYIRTNYPDSGISRRQVMRWLKLQKPWQLTARPPVRQTTSLMDIRKPGYMSCDLKGPLAVDQGYNYVFGLCDVASRKTYTCPIKDKTAIAARDALKSILDNNDIHISLLRNDNGGEFKEVFSEFLKERNIIQLFSAPHSPWLNRVERQWRTLFDMVYKHQVANKTKAWVNILPTIVDNMNNTQVSSIKMTPNEAQDGLPDEVNAARSKKYGVSKRFASNRASFVVGDFVRLRIRDKDKYSKDKQVYSDDVYIISKVIHATKTSLVTYKITRDGLENEKPSYNITDLLLVNDSHDLTYPELSPEEAAVGERTITDQREVNELLINTPDVSVIRESRNPKPDAGGEYELERIISKRKFGKKTKYLLKYVGYPVSASTWEEAKNINAPDLLAAFRKQDREKKKKR